MNTHAWRAGSLLGALLFSLVACSSSASREHRDFEATVARTQVALAARQDADAIAASEALADGPEVDATMRYSMLTRAAALDPDRPDLVWLQINACRRVPECDPTPLVERLHRLDPDNGTAWGVLLDDAVKRGDASAIDRTLTDIADSKRLDIYWNPLIARLTTAAINTHTGDAGTLLTAVIGRQAALAIPAYAAVARACRPPATDNRGRIETCRRIANALRRGDTYITEMVGVAIARRVWPETSAEYNDAIAARRLASYRMQVEGSILPDKLRTKSEVLAYLQLLSTHRREQDVVLALIIGAGRDSDPPADWKETSIVR